MSQNKARVQTVALERFARVIVMSDLHGDLSGFHAVQRQVGLTGQDALVLVGDLLEKGERSLELLQTVMRMTRAGNTFFLLGDRDTILSEWYNNEITDDEMWRYLSDETRRAGSIVGNMAAQLGMELQTKEQLLRIKAAIRTGYAEELHFLEMAPHIIDCAFATFVHAGIGPGPLREQECTTCLAAPEFDRQTYCFAKPVVVGHWPVSNYCETALNMNPHFNTETHVASIDGGNGVKRGGQINYLVFTGGGSSVEYGAYDALPRIRALEAQPANPEPASAVFPRTEVRVLERGTEHSRCYFPALKRELTVPTKQLWLRHGKTYARDFTNHRLPVQPGDELRLCGEDEDGNGTLVKRDGIVGYYNGKYERI
jgi:protein phosphatase